MTKRFAVIQLGPGQSSRLLGVRPLVVVEARGLAAQGVATALERVARKLRQEASAVLRVGKPRTLRIVRGGRHGRV